jgi:flavin reductase (DIM6/NTAB) family NADH-FMN oxidoreductase RutF
VASALAALECVVHQYIDLPPASDGRQSHVVIGRIVGLYIADGLITADGRVDEQKLRPLSRLGYMNYGTLGEIFECMRPA